MKQLLRISKAATLALHTTVLMAAKPEELLSTKNIAEILCVSENHLSKVLQRLTKTGIVSPVRGPKGGFQLSKPADKVSLLEVYEAIEGQLVSDKCLLSYPRCDGKMCILGDLLETVYSQVRDYLSKTRLTDLVNIFQKGIDTQEVHN
jgi:Rrf2 family protein